MGLSSARELNASSLSTQAQQPSKKVGWVVDVILDEENEYAKSTKVGVQAIGAVKFRTTDNKSTAIKDLPLAYPFDKNFKNLPIISEQIEIYEGEQGSLFYRRIGLDENPTKSAFKNANAKNFSSEKSENQIKEDYKTVEYTGNAKTNIDGSNDEGGYGKYYDIQQGIHRLKLYEGDSLIEARFGQSIRFSGYNNPKNVFAPTIILRNTENSKSNKNDEGISTEEDLNRDGSIIALTSGQFQLPFIPGILDDNSKSDFETQPDSFVNYPTKLIGDQILLNSGRIILSAKSGEMIFYSKKNYGFISDGALSIDNKLGIDINVNDDIHIVTNDKDVNIVSGKGSIFLGSENLEPIVKGQQLVDILSQLIDAITQQTFLTPSGPTAVGPVNISQFGTIKSKLNDILSKLNQTS